MLRRSFLALCAAALTALPGLPQAASLFGSTPFQASWSPETGALTLRFYNRCTSGGMTYQGNDITAAIEGDDLLIAGHFRFHSDLMVMTADCMNRQSETVHLTDIAPGTYRIVQDCQAWAEIVLGDAAVQETFDPQFAARNRPGTNPGIQVDTGKAVKGQLVPGRDPIKPPADLPLSLIHI